MSEAARASAELRSAEAKRRATDASDALARALLDAAGDDAEHRIRFGLARSSDGYEFERQSNQPVLSPSEDGFDAGCVEDARIVKIDDMQLLAIGQNVTGMEVSVQAKYSNLAGTFETRFDARENLL